MILDLILGVTLDTPFIIRSLRNENVTEIVVLDYDYFDNPYIIDGVLYASTYDAKKLIRNYDTVNYYKSLYIYPSICKDSIYKSNKL